jgi:hypothetical protein
MPKNVMLGTDAELMKEKIVIFFKVSTYFILIWNHLKI